MVRALLVGLASAGVAFAKPRLAVVDLSPQNLSAGTAATVSDLLRTEIFRTGRFVVVERAEMERILQEQSFQMSGCVETACVVEAGRLLGAEKMVVGSVGRLGMRYVVSARVVDVGRGAVEAAESVEAFSEEDLPRAVRELVARLTGGVSSQGAFPGEVAVASSRPGPTSRRGSGLGLTGWRVEVLGGSAWGSMDLKFAAPLSSAGFDAGMLGVPGVAGLRRTVRWDGLVLGETRPFPLTFRWVSWWDVFRRGPARWGWDTSFDVHYGRWGVLSQVRRVVVNGLDGPEVGLAEGFHRLTTLGWGVGTGLRWSPDRVWDVYAGGMVGVSANWTESDCVREYDHEEGVAKAPSKVWGVWGGYYGCVGGVRIWFVSRWGLMLEGRWVVRGVMQDRSVDADPGTEFTETAVLRGWEAAVGLAFR